MRAPVDTIAAPLFPTKLPWVNTSGSQASILQRGKPMLVEFWDFCRPNSIRTLPYVKAWHERYADDGLRVIGVHCPGFEPSHSEQAVRNAVERLSVKHPVLIDSDFEVWREYENRGWPARYLFDGHARLFDYHYGEGAYEETELAIQELLGVRREPLPPLRPEDAPDACLAAQTADRPGAWSGPYEAGGVWAVLDGTGTVTWSCKTTGNGETDGDGGGGRTSGDERTSGDGSTSGDGETGGDGGTSEKGDRGQASEDEGTSAGRTLVVEHPGAYLLVEHEHHTAGVLDLQIDSHVQCLATCFTPGVA